MKFLSSTFVLFVCATIVIVSVIPSSQSSMKIPKRCYPEFFECATGVLEQIAKNNGFEEIFKHYKPKLQSQVCAMRKCPDAGSKSKVSECYSREVHVWAIYQSAFEQSIVPYIGYHSFAYTYKNGLDKCAKMVLESIGMASK